MENIILWKIPLILMISGSLQVALTVPDPRGTAQERQRYEKDHKVRDAVPIPSRWGPTIYKAVGHGISILEVVAILTSLYPSTLRSLHLDWVVDSPYLQQGSKVSISSPFIFGFILSIIGAYIRLTCYRYLGSQFTFALTLQKDHKLITSGPYSIVRHPGYTGAFIFYLGSLVSQMGPGSFWWEAGLWTRTPHDERGTGTAVWLVIQALGIFYAGWRLWVSYALYNRTKREDIVLMNEFRDQWVVWSKKTPYRLIPYVY